MTDRASNLVPQLVTLRWCACLGQVVAVVIAGRVLGLTWIVPLWLAAS